eukprot:TRINITY_DN5365_c0_g1_i2.p1 TRINITY_DN5365_c0_g1~~TRINITY_DN5365_c0_g1_i2.p1  ORF type:complete len:507 (-),score=161.49 TRINITY_DN5365_c0_g1_i2:2397-3791(-)
MDIKQPLVCSAILSLGKDMTFRDFAQGAFRMRGIGKGQVIRLFVIPEVKQLIIKNLSLAKKQSIFSGKAADVGAALRDVCSWLIINGMKSEKMQFRMLCEQNMANIWRKRALEYLIEEYKKVGKESAVDVNSGQDSFMHKSLDVFRERMDFSVENSVPKVSSLSDRLSKLTTLYQSLLYEEDFVVVEYIQGLIKGTVELNSPIESKDGYSEEGEEARGFESENMQEDEDEDEDEQEQEQEQEVLQEAQQEVENMDEEEIFQKKQYNIKVNDPYTWTLDQLREHDPPECKTPGFAFYPLSQFKLYKESKEDPGGKPLNFPSYIVVSQNYFNRESHMMGHKRLKNVIISLEWIPSVNNLKEVSSTSKSGAAKELDSRQQEHLHRAFSMFDLDGNSQLTQDELIAILKALDVNVTDDTLMKTLDVGFALKFPLGFREFKEIVVNQSFHKIHKGRFFCHHIPGGGRMY